MRVWRPDTIIDDQTLDTLDVHLGFEGMQDEIKNLESCETGWLMSEHEALTLKKLNPKTRIIPSRWVCAYKSPTRVRCRIVGKDLAKGTSARKMGYSIEALRILLVNSAQHDLRLLGLDVAHAFMHSPLPEDQTIRLKMPQSVSRVDGSVAYMRLQKALNGLRDASLHWLRVLADTVKEIGMVSDECEPCLYQGAVHNQAGKKVGIALLLIYVDDLLLGTYNQETEDVLVKAIGAAVPVKRTGHIMSSDSGGGQLTFIGRTLVRNPGELAIHVLVPASYLDTTFKEYGVVRETDAVPDVASYLEKTVDDANAKQPLSQEAYQRFRKALGKLLWLSQTRHDLKLFLSLLGTQQQSPCQGTEAALRSLFRFLKNDSEVTLKLPSLQADELTLEGQDPQALQVHSFSDASHRPWTFNARKGVAGGVVMFQHGVIRTMARQQHATALSSCEAELYALHLIAQESVALARLIQRVLEGLTWHSAEELVPIVLESDSSSALQLVSGADVPRRSRHIEIRLEWMRAKVETQELTLLHRAGTCNCADLFTKCLPSKDYFRHRSSIGMNRIEFPTQSLSSVCASENAHNSSSLSSLRYAAIRTRL